MTDAPGLKSRTPGARTAPAVILLLALIALLSILSLGVGSVAIPPGATARVLASQLPFVGERIDVSDVSEGRREIVLRIRPPRVAVALLVGMALALAGTIMQGFFQNPMADPYIIGVSSGAALGVALALTLGVDFWLCGVSALSLFAFAGALIVTFVVYALSRRGSRVPTGTLLLTGVAVGALVSAVTSFLLLYRTNDLRPVVQWLMGNLSGKQWSHVTMIAPYVVLGVPLGLLHARELNALLSGDEPAMYLGVDVGRTRLTLLVLSALLAAAAVSVAGVVGFVGLVVPHIMRMIVGPDHRRLLPVATLGGGVLLLTADILSRVATQYDEIPVGVVTSLMGCPFFLFLLHRSKQTGA